MNFVVHPWVNAADYWSVYFDLNENMKLRFDKEGINIPYPQRDVHLHPKVSGLEITPGTVRMPSRTFY